MLRTLIVDDEVKCRKALVNLIDYYCEDVVVVGEAINVATGIQAIEKFEPDLLLLDVEMTDGTGFDLLRQLPDVELQADFYHCPRTLCFAGH